MNAYKAYEEKYYREKEASAHEKTVMNAFGFKIKESYAHSNEDVVAGYDDFQSRYEKFWKTWVELCEGYDFINNHDIEKAEKEIDVIEDLMHIDIIGKFLQPVVVAFNDEGHPSCLNLTLIVSTCMVGHLLHSVSRSLGLFPQMALTALGANHQLHMRRESIQQQKQ